MPALYHSARAAGAGPTLPPDGWGITGAQSPGAGPPRALDFGIVSGMETLRTTINREYAARFLGVALLFVAFAGWFVYDGKIGYPRENARTAPVAERLAARTAAEKIPAADWVNTAKTGVAPLAEAFRAAGMEPPAKLSDTFNSWVSAGDPRMNDVEATRAAMLTPPHSEEDIRAQFVSAAIGLLAALALAGLVAWRWGTALALDGEALTVSRFGKARRFPLAALREVDDSQWAKRGILRLRFEGGAVTLDAWHHAGVRPMAERLLASAPKTV